MAETFDLSVAIKVRAEGAGATDDELKGLQDRVDELARSGAITEGEVKSLTTAIGKNADENRKAKDATQSNTESVNAQRYALYEVAAAYGAVSAALIGVGAASVTAFADMESGFSQVERTTGLVGGEFQSLQDEILQVSRTIPAATKELQDFAARGAQMDVPTDELAEFTEVMAKFVATSPDVDVASVAESFGRIANLTGTNDFQALASAVSLVEVNAVATNAQILKTAEGVARASAAFGFAAEDVIGLSAAMASMGVQPEAARGIMVQYINTVENGVAGASDSLLVMSKAMGISEESARKLWKTDPGAFTQSLVEALSKSDNLITSLGEMGVTGQRITPLFAALTKDFTDNAEGMSVFSRSMSDASRGIAERTELDKQYLPIADDLNSKFVLMSNAVLELAYSVGTELAPTLKVVMDGIIGTAQAASDFVNNPIGGFVTRMVVTLGALVTVYTTLRAAVALATAFTIAFRTASGQAAATGLAGSLANLIGMYRTTGTAAAGAAVGTARVTLALKALGRATVIGAALMYVSEWLFNTGAQAVKTGEVMIWLADLAVEVGTRIGGAFGGLAAFNATNFLRTQGADLKKWGSSLDAITNKTDDFKNSWGDVPAGIEEAADNTGDLEDGFDGAADAAKDVAAEVRTLVDYANDLSSVWKRAFEIRFSSGQAEDTITKTFNDLKKAAAESAQKMRDLRLEIRGLQADLGVLGSDIKTQQYFLSVAVEYGDSKRAAEIQANLVKLQADMANKQEELKKKQADLTKEQESNSKTLKGNSDQAINNRKTILDLVQSYQSQIEALAKSGMSSDELARRTKALEQDFIRQATQLGFNRAELSKYTKGFQDVKVAIDKVPRNITIKANADPALQAFEEFKAKADSASKSLTSLRNNVSKGVGSMPSVDTFGARQQAMQARLNAAIALLESYRRAKDWGNMRDQDNFVENLRRQLANGNFYTGGFTGQGGKYEPAGIVHKGEYVVPKHQVNQRTGLPHADAMGNLTRGSQARTSYAGGGFVGGGINGPVDLSAHTIQQLARVIKTDLIVDGRIIGEVASNSYAANTRVGAA